MAMPDTPLLTADTIIEIKNKIILIERKYEPFGFAIPGGFVDVGETVEQAAIREAKEETCLDVELRCLLGVYSDPARDKRGHNACSVFIARATGKPQAGDDACNILLIDIFEPLPPLAFDHEQVLMDYKNFLQTGKIPSPMEKIKRLQNNK